MPTNNRPSNKRVIAITPRIRYKVIAKRCISTRLIHPSRQRLHKQFPRRRGTGRGGPHLPIALGPQPAIIERHAVSLGERGVEGGLHVVEGVWDDGEIKQKRGVRVVQNAVGFVPLVGEPGVGVGGADSFFAPGGVVGGCKALVCGCSDFVANG
jgi:hypothetical protein